MKWIWKEVEKTWVCGEPNLGCGVYETKNGWEGNVVIYNQSYGLPNRPTKEAIMAEAEARFDKCYEQYHEVVN